MNLIQYDLIIYIKKTMNTFSHLVSWHLKTMSWH